LTASVGKPGKPAPAVRAALCGDEMNSKSSRGSVAIDIFRYKKDASPANSK
jgi:hypothetical protein